MVQDRSRIFFNYLVRYLSFTQLVRVVIYCFLGRILNRIRSIRRYLRRLMRRVRLGP